jgi:transcriptional regulator with XRE-family HTH domain
MVSGQRALEARNSLGLSRERVAALCDPPISAKTLERWEKGISPLPRWRAQQLAAIGDVDRNGDLVSSAGFGPGTPLLGLVVQSPDEPTASGPLRAVGSLAGESTEQLRARVRSARETKGPKHARWSDRERRAFRTLAERGLTC